MIKNKGAAKSIENIEKSIGLIFLGVHAIVKGVKVVGVFIMRRDFKVSSRERYLVREKILRLMGFLWVREIYVRIM
jgi:hypothetical protein